MAIIDSDCQYIGDKLEQLVRLIKTHGGLIHESVIIRSRRGDLSIHCQQPPCDKTPLLFIPENCLPVIKHFDLTLNDNALQFTSSKKASPLQIAIFEIMVTIFNFADKFKQHRHNFPLIQIRKIPELVSVLEHKLPMFITKSEALSEDQLVISTFFHSRTLDYQHSNGDNFSVVMPLIDCVNHNTAAANFINTTAAIQYGIGITCSQPLASSDECLVSYNKIDPLKQWLCYGFTEENPAFLRSLPLKVNLDKLGEVEIDYFEPDNAPLVNIPSSAKHIAHFMPRIKHHDNSIRISHTLIPNSSTPRALRRMLSIALRPIIKTPSDLERAVATLEKRIIKGNREYHSHLHTIIDKFKDSLTEDVYESIKDMCCKQERMLESYQQFTRGIPLAYNG